ncbi:MAG: GGDEF domain-containing protein [Thiomicrospira sp.]|uniref:GGDEF domain-containing protein n=1 Tax=Thiomicrospira sp. TaxID=935 RepID=UPI001A0A1599|nr:GGDEF domain-containing protein [Thiomicrospira sp.]MBE0493080.1 GGDEF domain-containing protein [Thiomicrospira sp.]
MADDQDNLNRARKIFERISQVFSEQEITPSPLNYQVWYEYFKGDKPKFRQEMDSILNDPFGYNDRTGRRLFDEYLKDDKPTSDLDRVFKRLLDAMVKKLSAWTDKLSSQNQQLNDYALRLSEPNIDPEKLKNITDSILHTTRDLRHSSEDVQQDLVQASLEIQTLREQLIEARAESMKDELTELGNRKAFNIRLEELAEEFAERPDQLHLILIDIDHFKNFNDQYGHLVGDSVLRYFANLLRNKQRPKNTLCRYGGEEFAILMNDSSLEQAQDCAETLRAALKKAKLKRRGTNEVLPEITASFGIAQFRAGEKLDDFINRADDMLYKAKQTGRDKVLTEFDTPSI